MIGDRERLGAEVERLRNALRKVVEAHSTSYANHKERTESISEAKSLLADHDEAVSRAASSTP